MGHSDRHIDYTQRVLLLLLSLRAPQKASRRASHGQKTYTAVLYCCHLIQMCLTAAMGCVWGLSKGSILLYPLSAGKKHIYLFFRVTNTSKNCTWYSTQYSSSTLVLVQQYSYSSLWTTGIQRDLKRTAVHTIQQSCGVLVQGTGTKV